MRNVLARWWRAHRAKVAAMDTHCAEIDAELPRPADDRDRPAPSPRIPVQRGA